MLRCGLLGLGDAGRHHARALATASDAVAWTALGVRDVAATVPPGVPATARIMSSDELLAGGACDAVIIASPDGLHHEHAARALAAGMHVLVEKPIALELAHAHALVAAAVAGDRVLQVGYQLRHHAGHEAMHAELAARIGAVRTVHVRWAWPDPAVAGWRARGDRARWWALAALGTHAIDLALWFADADPVEVVSVIEPPTGIDHAAEVSLRFATGALAHISVAITHRALPQLVIAGERGELEARGTLGARGAGAIAHRAGGTAAALAFTPEDPYARQLRAFGARCAGVGLGPRIDPHAVTNLAVLERIIRR